MEKKRLHFSPVISVQYYKVGEPPTSISEPSFQNLSFYDASINGRRKPRKRRFRKGKDGDGHSGTINVSRQGKILDFFDALLEVITPSRPSVGARKHKLESSDFVSVVYYNPDDPPADLFKTKKSIFQRFYSGCQNACSKVFPPKKEQVKAPRDGLCEESKIAINRPFPIENFGGYEVPPSYVFGNVSSKFYRLTKWLMEDRPK